MGSFLLQSLLQNVDRLKIRFAGKVNVYLLIKTAVKFCRFPVKQSLEQDKRAEWKLKNNLGLLECRLSLLLV